MIIDSHAHIDFTGYDDDRDEVIARARSAGVDLIVAVGNGDIIEGSHEHAQQIAESYPFIYTTVGLHPHDAKLYNEQIEAYLLKLCKHRKVIAWGECGLDYYYMHSPQETQRRAFIRQLELAKELRLPVIIHTRDAEADTIDILHTYWAATGLRGIMHCFTGSYELAKAAIDIGMLISFSGIITFKKSAELRSVAAKLPLDTLLVETDCPFLSPEPHRGRRNEPVRSNRCRSSFGQSLVCGLARIGCSYHGKLF